MDPDRQQQLDAIRALQMEQARQRDTTASDMVRRYFAPFFAAWDAPAIQHAKPEGMTDEEFLRSIGIEP